MSSATCTKYTQYDNSSNNHHFTAIIQVNLHQPAPPVKNSRTVGAKFYCPQALADGNQRIRFRDKTLEFSSTALSTLSPYI